MDPEGVHWGCSKQEILHFYSDFSIKLKNSCEPGHEKMCLMSYANNKGADQPAHPRCLIIAFIVRCLDSIISLNFIAENSRLQLASVAAQAGLCLAWSKTPKYTFSHGEAHKYSVSKIFYNKPCIRPWCKFHQTVFVVQTS